MFKKENLYYYGHLMLSSRLKFLLPLLAYLLTLFFIEGSWVNCMNSPTDVPSIFPTIEGSRFFSQQNTSIKDVITSYVNDLNELKKMVAKQEEIIMEQQHCIDMQEHTIQQLRGSDSNDMRRHHTLLDVYSGLLDERDHKIRYLNHKNFEKELYIQSLQKQLAEAKRE